MYNTKIRRSSGKINNIKYNNLTFHNASNDLDPEVLKRFKESEERRYQRLKDQLPAAGELDVNLNHAEYLLSTGDVDGKRLFDQAQMKKYLYLAGHPQPEYRPSTQTQTKRDI